MIFPLFVNASSMYQEIDILENGDIKECDTRAVAFEIFGVICSGVMLRYENNKKIDIGATSKKFSNIVINGILEK